MLLFRILKLLGVCLTLTSCSFLCKPPLPREALFATIRPNIDVYVYPQDIRSQCQVTNWRNQPYYISRPRSYSVRPLNSPPYNASYYCFYNVNAQK